MNGFPQAFFVALVPEVSTSEVRFTRPRLFAASRCWLELWRRTNLQPETLLDLLRYVVWYLIKIVRLATIQMGPSHGVGFGNHKRCIHSQAVAVFLNAPFQDIVNNFARNFGRIRWFRLWGR